jgi:hypothetical protein
MARASWLQARDANAELPDPGGNRLKEEQACFRVVLDNLSNEAETVALADVIRSPGAGELQVKDVHIFELEVGSNRRLGTLVPGIDEDVVSSVVVAVIDHVRDRTVELDGPAAVLGHEGCDRLIAAVRNRQKGCKLLTVVGRQDLLVVRPA